MRYLKIFLLTLCIAASCKDKPDPAVFNQDIQQVITSCIISSIGKGDTVRYYYKLIPKITEKEYLRFGKRYNDSLKSLLDTSLVYLIIKDTLGRIGAGSREDLEHFVKNNLSDIDSSMLYYRQDYLNPSPQTIDLIQLERDVNISIKSNEQGVNDKLRVIGKCFFSNVVFNKSKTKAILLLDFMTTTHIGYGEIFLLEKADTTWRVMKRERTWVS